MVRAVTIALILIGLFYITSHNSSVTTAGILCKGFCVDFSLHIGSLQMWILLVGAANTSQGHPVSKCLQQSLLSLLISSTKHMRYYCNQDGSSFPSSPNWAWWEYTQHNIHSVLWAHRSQLPTVAATTLLNAVQRTEHWVTNWIF